MGVKRTFGEKLYAMRIGYRDKHGVPRRLSIREAAAMVPEEGYKISHGGYARWEQPSAAIPNRNAIRAICTAFNCRPSSLFEEFYGAPSTSKNARVKKFDDVHLLPDHLFDILEKTKDEFIRSTIIRDQLDDTMEEDK